MEKTLLQKIYFCTLIPVIYTKKHTEFIAGSNAAFLLAVSRFGLGIVVVKCCRGNGQEVECLGSPAEDRILQR